MARSVITVCALAALLMPVTTFSQQPQGKMKPGLWRTTIQTDGPMPARAPTGVSQICVDGAFKAQDLHRGGPTPTMAGCTFIRYEKTADGSVFESKCQRGGLTIHAVRTSKETATHSESYSSIDSDDAGAGTARHITIRTSTDWVGACPPGMKTNQIQFQPPLGSAAAGRANADAPPPAKTVEATDLEWVRRPSEPDMAMYFPLRGKELSKSASTRVRCVLHQDGTLGACALQGETPVGYGFGDASLRVAKLYQAQMTAELLAGVRNGGIAVTVPLSWTPSH